MAICLNSDGIHAWKAAGSESHTDLGARVVAIRLLLSDSSKKDVGIFLISAYAPVGNAPDVIWNDFFDKLSTCISRKRAEDILVIGADCNASMGLDATRNSPLGRFGLSYVNASGKRFLS